VGSVTPEPCDTIVIQSHAAMTAAPEALSLAIMATPRTRSQKNKGLVGASPPHLNLCVMAPSEAPKFPTYNLSGAHMSTTYTQPSGLQGSLSRKCSALVPPSEAAPSSLKSACTSESSSAGHMPLIMSSSSSHSHPKVISLASLLSCAGSKHFEAVDNPLLMHLKTLEMSLQHSNISEAHHCVQQIHQWHAESKWEGE